MLDSALGWIGQIAEWIGKWIPRWVNIEPTEGGLKYESFFLPRKLRVRWGGFDGDQRITYCGPGMHWYWPVTSQIPTWPIVLQTDNLPSQTIETLDGKGITIGGMVTYTVTDLLKLATMTHSSMKLIQVLALATIHAECCKLNWDDLREKQRKRTLNTLLRNGLQKELNQYGVKIDDCMLTDLVRTKAFRLIQSTQQDEMV